MLLRRKPRPAPTPTPVDTQRAIRQMMGRRAAELHTVHKQKFTLEGSPLGVFEAWMESPDSLPLVIRGQAGRFSGSGQWMPA